MGKPVEIKFSPHKKKTKRFSTRFNILFLLVNIAFLLLNSYCFYRFNWKHDTERVETASVMATVDSAVIVTNSVADLSKPDSAPATMAPNEVIDNNFEVHVVSEGQTLYTLSRIYHVPVDSIKKANQLVNNTILLGERLKIPKQNEY
jgi:LysM repeat protein